MVMQGRAEGWPGGVKASPRHLSGPRSSIKGSKYKLNSLLLITYDQALSDILKLSSKKHKPFHARLPESGNSSVAA